MEGKTKVRVKFGTTQNVIKKDETGYIDGYVASDHGVFAIVISDSKIVNIPLHCLEVIK